MIYLLTHLLLSKLIMLVVVADKAFACVSNPASVVVETMSIPDALFPPFLPVVDN